MTTRAGRRPEVCYVRDTRLSTWHAARYAVGFPWGPALCGEPAPSGHWALLYRWLPTAAVLCPACRAAIERGEGSPS